MTTQLLELPRLEATTTSVPWSGPYPDPHTCWQHADGEIIRLTGVSRNRLGFVRGIGPRGYATNHEAGYWEPVTVWSSGPIVVDEPVEVGR